MSTTATASGLGGCLAVRSFLPKLTLKLPALHFRTHPSTQAAGNHYVLNKN